MTEIFNLLIVYFHQHSSFFLVRIKQTSKSSGLEAAIQMCS